MRHQSCRFYGHKSVKNPLRVLMFPGYKIAKSDAQLHVAGPGGSGQRILDLLLMNLNKGLTWDWRFGNIRIIKDRVYTMSVAEIQVDMESISAEV